MDIAFFIGALFILLWAGVILGSIGMLIWAIVSRIKEKKIEKDKNEKYKDY